MFCIATPVSILRGLVIQKLGGCGHEETIAKARSLFAAHVADPANSAIPSDLRAAVYSIVLKTEDDGQTLDLILEVSRIYS